MRCPKAGISPHGRGRHYTLEPALVNAFRGSCGSTYLGLGSPPQPGYSNLVFQEWENCRWGAGVVERGGLENRCALAGTVGSNPTPTAIYQISTIND